jgi:hypothetical protein
MIAHIDAFRERFGVEPICTTLHRADLHDVAVRPVHLLVGEAPAGLRTSGP